MVLLSYIYIYKYLISAGAKPPKNKYKNYKVLLKERKKEKNREQKRKQIQQLSKTRLIRTATNKKNIDKNRKKEKGLLEIYGKVKVKLFLKFDI